MRETLFLWIPSPVLGVTCYSYLEQRVYGRVERPSEASRCTIFLKDKCLSLSLVIYEFNCCAFYYVHENELCVLMNLLAAFTCLNSVDNCMSLTVRLFVIMYLITSIIHF
jgi:hypothetical protein